VTAGEGVLVALFPHILLADTHDRALKRGVLVGTLNPTSYISPLSSRHSNDHRVYQIGNVRLRRDGQPLNKSTMTPRIFKWLLREKPPEPPSIRRTEPCSLGIDDSTCEVTESVTNPCKLPIPPSLDPSRENHHHHELSASSSPANPQRQSGFFKLPAEIRQQIYTEVLGGRRVHIDYDFAEPTGWRHMKKKKYSRQWRWWHHVCADGDSFIEDDSLWDRCPRRVLEEETEEWTLDGRIRDRRTTKIRGAGWLRTCRRG
jgi:hypothetical protein